MFRTAVLVEGGLGALALVLGYFLGPSARQYIPPFEQWPAIAAGIGFGIIATVPLLVFMAILRRVKHPAVEELDELSDHPMIGLMLQLGPLELFIISLCAGVGEELLFRGWLMPAMANLFEGDATSLLPLDPNAVRPWWAFGGWSVSLSDLRASVEEAGGGLSFAAVWADLTAWWSTKIGWSMTLAWIGSSILFGFVHPITKLYIAVTGLMGLYFGLLLLLTGNLMVPLVAHTLYDAVQLWSVSGQPGDESTSDKSE